jgi:hypothetical protein
LFVAIWVLRTCLLLLVYLQRVSYLAKQSRNRVSTGLVALRFELAAEIAKAATHPPLIGDGVACDFIC